jgi:DNA modification methylase
MRLNTEPGDICYEPFSGSGSQLCAAQSTDRICYAMELAPPYVAIALERLSEMDLSPKLAKS